MATSTFKITPIGSTDGWELKCKDGVPTRAAVGGKTNLYITQVDFDPITGRLRSWSTAYHKGLEVPATSPAPTITYKATQGSPAAVLKQAETAISLDAKPHQEPPKPVFSIPKKTVVVPTPDEEPDDDWWDIDDDELDDCSPEQKDFVKKETHEDEIRRWVENLREDDELQYIDSEFLAILDEPDSPSKRSLMAFLCPMSGTLRDQMIASGHGWLVGKYAWVDELDWEQAYLIGKRINSTRDEGIIAILADQDSFRAFCKSV